MALTKSRHGMHPTGDDLVGHEWERANKCSGCKGALQSGRDGHYHSTSFPVEPLCCKCAGCAK